MVSQYGQRIDAVVYGSEKTATYTREDWVRLALAALDQADVTPAQLANAHQHGTRHGAGVNGVLHALDIEPPYLTTEHVPA